MKFWFTLDAMSVTTPASCGRECDPQTSLGSEPGSLPDQLTRAHPRPERRTQTVQRFVVIAISVVTLAIGVAACGGSSSKSASSAASPATSTSSSSTSAAPAGGGASTISDAADPSGALKFANSSLTAKAGKVTVKFTNASSLPHNFTIASSGGSVVGATPTFSGGGTKTVTVTLKPGTYTFYCSVDGHRAAGMQGTLTVK
jgi:plastocyanin